MPQGIKAGSVQSRSVKSQNVKPQGVRRRQEGMAPNEALAFRPTQSPQLQPPQPQATQPIDGEDSKPRNSNHNRNDNHNRNGNYNRLAAILFHISWYSFKTQVRLAQDTGLSKAAISRIIRGFHCPSYPAALLITRALEKRLQRPLDPREIFSLDGAYPTPSVCTLVGCRNCLPDAAYGDNGVIRPEYKELKAGQWSMSSSTNSEPALIKPVR